jgi:hypothetical protein
VAEKIQEGMSAIPPVFGLHGLIFDTRKYVMDSHQPARGQPRKIIGFHKDELSDWIADQSAGISSTSAIIRHGLNDIGSRPPRAAKHILARNYCAWRVPFSRSGSRGLYALVVLNSDVLPRIRPMRLRLVKEPFDNSDYIFELKQDGFRAAAYINEGECRLVSRDRKSAVNPRTTSSFCVRRGQIAHQKILDRHQNGRHSHGIPAAALH